MTKRPSLALWFAASAMVFFTRALLFSTWQSRGPEIRTALELSTTEMGALVMLFPAGGLAGILFAERITRRFGSRRVTVIGYSTAAIGLASLGVAIDSGSLVLSCIALIAMGLPMAIGDFLGNFEGTHVDRLSSRSLFPAIHAAYGVGMLLGAAISSYFIGIKVGISAHYIGIAIVVAGASIWAGLTFPYQNADNESSVASTESVRAIARSVWTERRTQAIALIGFTFIMAEMSAGTWMPIALTDSGFSASAAAAAFSVFWVVVTLGRMIAGTIVDAIGRFPTILASCVTSIVGIGLFMASISIPMTYAGLILWGFGIAAGFPMSVNSMGDDPVMAPYRINMIITMVYLSSITVGPALGLVGQSLGLYVAFGIPVVFLIISTILSPVTKPELPGSK